jgi:hypothetical protein
VEVEVTTSQTQLALVDSVVAELAQLLEDKPEL